MVDRKAGEAITENTVQVFRAILHSLEEGRGVGELSSDSARLVEEAIMEIAPEAMLTQELNGTRETAFFIKTEYKDRDTLIKQLHKRFII
jgi:hypothetical protein